MPISSDFKKKIHQLIKEKDNSEKILLVLKYLGPQKFTDLESHCEISRSTVSKYIKLNIGQKNIEKKIFTKGKINEPRYFITKRGLRLIEEKSTLENNELFYVNSLNENLSRLSNLIEFYKEIGIPETLYLQIIHTIMKIGDKFFLIEQNQDLYYTLFYIFFNSIIGQGVFAEKYWNIEEKTANQTEKGDFSGYKLNKSEFIDFFKLKPYKIDYFIDKIMTHQLGFYMFNREKEGSEDAFFFHEEDLLGSTTMALIKDAVIEGVIHRGAISDKEIYDLDAISEEIAGKLKEMGLIWDAIIEEFEMMVQKLFVKTAKDMGVSNTFLMDSIIQSKKVAQSKEGKNSVIKIIEGSEDWEDLNLVSITETKEGEFTETPTISGFCPNCGKTISKIDLISSTCPRCENSFDPSNLIKDHDKASEKFVEYKEIVVEKTKGSLVKCPKCEYQCESSWMKCPICGEDI
ncbi:MAG: hypothetical protein JW891_13445 [Candidatus Lokiarchaeota archaeon]|nr:hypothetical protein [Candidatus Lokiarchaeota archaeon]